MLWKRCWNRGLTKFDVRSSNLTYFLIFVTTLWKALSRGTAVLKNRFFLKKVTVPSIFPIWSFKRYKSSHCIQLWLKFPPISLQLPLFHFHFHILADLLSLGGKVGKGIIGKAPELVPTAENVYMLSKQTLIGLPFELLLSGIDKLCKFALILFCAKIKLPKFLTTRLHCASGKQLYRTLCTAKNRRNELYSVHGKWKRFHSHNWID